MVNLCTDINFNNFETHFEIVGIKVYYSNEFVTYIPNCYEYKLGWGTI